MKVRFRVCCCLYDYYFHKLLAKGFLTICSSSYRQKDHGFIFTLCDNDELVQACYKCIYNAFLVTKFDEIKINQVLNQFCQIYYANSSHLEKINGTAKNYFEIIKHYLIRDYATIDRNFVIINCCFACFRNFIFNFLSDEFYYVDSLGQV